MPQQVQAGALRLGILSRLNSADTEADIESGFSGVPSDSAKIKSTSAL